MAAHGNRPTKGSVEAEYGSCLRQWSSSVSTKVALHCPESGWGRCCVEPSRGRARYGTILVYLI